MKTINLKQLTRTKALKGDFDATLKVRPGKHLKRMAALGTSPVLWRAWTGSFALKLLVLFFGMALWGCQKDKAQTTVIEGRITELGSFEPVRVAGLRLGLYKKQNAMFFPAGITKIAEFLTDENGEFYHEQNLDSYPGAYFVELLDIPNGYFALENTHYLNSTALNIVQLNLNKEAWLKVILNNQGGGDLDYFIFSINGVRYTHTGGGTPYLIQRVASYDTNRIVLADHRPFPEIYLSFGPVVPPTDTLDFEIDLRPQ